VLSAILNVSAFAQEKTGPFLIAAQVTERTNERRVVRTACGFSAKNLPAQLNDMNQEVAAMIESGEPLMPPGVPRNHPDPKKLVTEDCIRPKSSTTIGP